MDTGALLTASDDAVQRLIGAAERAPAARVDACPEWDVRELVDHCRGVITMWEPPLDAADGSRGERSEPEPVEPSQVVATFREEVEAFVERLRTTPDDQPCWTWWGDHVAAEVKRRVAHELFVHAWDAQHAVGDAQPIAAELAVDGIEEFFEVFGILGVKVRRAGWDGEPLRVVLHAEDAGRAWTAVFEPGEAPRLDPYAAGDQADATVRGTASALDLVLWGRIDLNDVDADGDVASVEEALAWLRV